MMIDIVLSMNRLLIIVKIILCLVVIVIVLIMLLRVREFVLFMKIVVGGVLNYRNLRLVLIIVL